MGVVKAFFQKLLSDSNESYDNSVQAKLLNGSPNESSPYSGELYANYLVRSIVHKIASYGSMISFEHVRGYGSQFEKVNDNINRCLTVKPNEMLMTPADLYYKIWTDLLVTNNSYQWLKRDKEGNLQAIYPIIADRVELKEKSGFLFYKFYFSNGDKILIHASDIVHNRRFYYKNDWFGSDNEPVRQNIGLLNTLDVSLDAALKNGAQIKGILKHANTIDPEDLAAQEKLFRESYLKAQNSGGIGMIDAKFDFIPVNYNGKIIDADQMKEIRDYVYRYFGVNDKIMTSEYSSDNWQSYHENVIAPILNNMAQNYNIHLFSDRELGYGNRVVSSVNMITFMNAQQRISMVKLALDGALYTRNEIRQWFGDAPIPGGDVFQYSKNFTENTNQNEEGGESGGEGATETGTIETNPVNSAT